MRDDNVSQSSPAAGIVGAGARYRPSLRIAAGGSGLHHPECQRGRQKQEGDNGEISTMAAKHAGSGPQRNADRGR